MSMDDEGEGGRKRRLGVASYFVTSDAEAGEIHELARLAGYKSLANLVTETMDAKREELREKYGPMLAQIKAMRETQ